MGDLIKRLEAATVGSRELDVLIWNATGGWPGVQAPPSFTGSLDSALALAERVLPGWPWMVRHYSAGQGGPGWTAYVCKPDADLVDAGPITSGPAIALCIAILRAIPEDKS